MIHDELPSGFEIRGVMLTNAQYATFRSLLREDATEAEVRSFIESLGLCWLTMKDERGHPDFVGTKYKQPLPNGNMDLTEAEWAEWRALNRKPGVTMAEIRAFVEGHGYEWLVSDPSDPSKSLPANQIRQKGDAA